MSVPPPTPEQLAYLGYQAFTNALVGAVGSTQDTLIISTVVGAMLTFMFGGVCLTQAIIYYKNYPKDLWWYKGIVALLLMLMIAELAMYIAMSVNVISHYNRYDIALRFDVLSGVVEWSLEGTVVFLTQLFFASRLWRLMSRPIWFWPIAGILISGSYAVSWFGTYQIYAAVPPSPLLPEQVPFLSDGIIQKKACLAWICAIFSVDSIITIATVAWFVRSHKRSELPQTQSLVQRLIILSVEAMVLPLLGTLVLLAVWIKYGHVSHWDRAVAMVQLPFYVHAVVFSLASRGSLTELSSHGAVSMPASAFAGTRASQARSHQLKSKNVLPQHHSDWKDSMPMNDMSNSGSNPTLNIQTDEFWAQENKTNSGNAPLLPFASHPGVDHTQEDYDKPIMTTTTVVQETYHEPEKVGINRRKD